MKCPCLSVIADRMRLRQPGHDLRRIPLVAHQVIVNIEIECGR
jgi:hypothetical protein